MQADVVIVGGGVIGSAVAYFLAAETGFAGRVLGFLLTRGAEAEPWRLFLGVGLLGGFTTFSAFSAETAFMVQNGEFGLALLYVLASVLGALALLFAGLWLVRAAT